ncbi:MAG: PilT/PilU family type 4a pilus ATPase [Candidatus Omnitrophica bacterium]|nr:PilT/PilU family type 4a pilus ATPase [Candidatus Omnitrophota bacterium]MCF7887786.1 PilT/PilU family type 4a pilus ATPase [Candidatus Omnitrophota bacterium]
MDIDNMFETMIEKNSSDLFIRAGSPLKARIDNKVTSIGDREIKLEEVNNLIKKLPDTQAKEDLKSKKNCEFTLWYKGDWRFRISIFFQRNTPAIVIRKINLKFNSFKELNLPAEILTNLSNQRRGMVLLTGATGSGKSTTIATMLEYINNNLGYHILTIEEPVEFTFKDNQSIINQREIGKDVRNYQEALKQFALHSPDVIFIGNIRDAETCYAALTAAETGVLVFSTIHTINASSTIQRIINFFPPHQHNLIISQLSTLLKGVVSQRLLPRKDQGLIPAYESMVLSPSISRLIRENKIWEIPKYIASGDIYGMRTFNQSLLELVESNKITSQTALEYSDQREDLEIELRNKNLI